MSTRFPSDEWAHALAAALGPDSAYVRAAAGWSAGQVALLVAVPADDAGMGGGAVLLNLTEHGAAGAEAMPAERARAEASLVLATSSATWARLLSSELDPVKALMNGDVKVEKGALATIVGQIFAYAELLRAAASITR